MGSFPGTFLSQSSQGSSKPSSSTPQLSSENQHIYHLPHPNFGSLVEQRIAQHPQEISVKTIQIDKNLNPRDLRCTQAREILFCAILQVIVGLDFYNVIDHIGSF